MVIQDVNCNEKVREEGGGRENENKRENEHVYSPPPSYPFILWRGNLPNFFYYTINNAIRDSKVQEEKWSGKNRQRSNRKASSEGIIAIINSRLRFIIKYLILVSSREKSKSI